MGKSFNDDDIRIAPSDLSQLFPTENPVADDNIDMFIRERSIGNTDRARVLGSRLVEDLLDCAWTEPPHEIDAHDFETQLRLLFAYVVHRIVEDYSPNQIVANAAVSSFYERLEDADPKLFLAVSTDPAFSLYLYLHRSGSENAVNVGKTFAKLCGATGNVDCAAVGEGAYARYVSACAQRMVSAGYSQQ